jgi:small-conductance mechanosensitive channel
VSVAYGTDLKKVCKILLDIANKHPNVIRKKGFEPIVRITDFGDSGIDITLIMWIDEVMNQWLVMSDVRMEIDVIFKKENITIPFPQRTVWINNLNNSASSRDEKKKS